ncbi:MAG: DUF1499 domain-containing protein [Asticcacaulis sp.]
MTLTDDTASTGGNPPGRRGSKKGGFAFAHLAFIIACIPVLFIAGVMLATHAGSIGVDLGFKTLTLRYGPKLALGALGISLLSLLISLFMNPKRYAGWALAALVVSGAVTGGYYLYEQMSRSFPPIADVATDWDTPLTFSDRLIGDRGAQALRVEDLPRVPSDQSMQWGGKTLAQINATTCPGAQPIRNRHIAADQIADVLKASHYEVFGRAPWRVEATYQDSFFGLKSDVVVRIDPDRIDIRSTGRDDLPDLGANCRRVTDLVRKIRALPDAPDAMPAADAAKVSSSATASGAPAPAAPATTGGDGGGD